MTAPNRNTLWARALVDELARNGVTAACVSPGSRSTPLTVAFAEHEEIRVFSHLDERAAAYFALGRARRTGEVTPLVCTSGTAAANYHPAILEADQSRVPLLALTADRPPELRDSGANQTADQEKLYGDAVRWYKDLPEPEAEARKLRSLRTTVTRALAEAEGTDPGPVHLNCPFRKPLEPVEVPEDVPEDLETLAAEGRESDGSAAPAGGAGGVGQGSSVPAFVERRQGTPELPDHEIRAVAEDLGVERGLIVAGPADPHEVDPEAVVALAHATGFPILADPLSGLRFGGHTRVAPVLGGYDAYLDEAVTSDWPDPEAVLRVGASPTSKPLRKYLARIGAQQMVVDPAGKWREAEFTASDLVVADPSRLSEALSRVVTGPDSADWRALWADAEQTHWDAVDAHEDLFEGGIVADAVAEAPEPTTLFVSNSMPVRDLDRFTQPSPDAVTALGNRGVSGIDGITSTALGAGSATTDHLTLVIGDLAYYHDMNGLLAVARCEVDATIVLINNDGGGIFHMLPIESFNPPFTGQFKTPHGIDFEPSTDLYGLDYEQVESRNGFVDAYSAAVASEGTTVVEVVTDAADSHEIRDRLREQVVDELAGESTD
ncbi:2-succinyl-5-enolpyruvyl-6-hydroxy-3-cyclohexene-1-carboxylic-acid synthase [Halolamina salifodinae]|uniref:2-succinyl-5-enolpyruvyl-6-hydroxy-3-cyclohexene-1-carboxylate synthase n=1 Tax=Halolamina salifodinae TaxID=1202767 RepID=A0A8T4GU99_9EURY|nr:2-succinyl-5-enolpyruvyl-6-hydroxy-3-cyclohexene-1-carboxylic-acid synthase [Halolamina salifodinae]MBP1986671.1 2-succinyl-5-enolpyruvyl-6-hydroxy-3-cyclohexene-1-carboxylate synthase [Halolamina salifodinae]